MKRTFWIFVVGCWLLPAVCRAQSNAPLITVTNGWLVLPKELPRPAAYREVPAHQYVVQSARIVDLVFKPDRVWVGVDYSVIVPPDFNLGEGLDFRAIFAFDPAKGRAEVWSESLAALPLRAEPALNALVMQPASGRFDVDAGALWVFARSNVLHRTDLKTKMLREFPVEQLDGMAPRVSALNGKVFLRTVDRFLQLDPGTGNVQLLASARRRPVATPLDELGNYDQFLLDTNAQGRVCLQRLVAGNPGEVRYAGWARTADDTGWEPVTQGDRPAFGTRPASDQQITYDASLTDPRVLAWNPGAAGASLPLLGPISLAPRWSYPVDYPPAQTAFDFPARAFFTGGNLMLFAPPAWADRYRRTRDGLPTAIDQGRLVGAPNGTAATLWLFRDAWEEPVVRHLNFGVLAGEQAELKLSGLTGTNLAAYWTPAGLLAIPADFAGPYGLPTATGFWWVPARQIDLWIAEDAARGAHLPRRQPHWLEKYDRNRDGRLNAEELALLQADPEFRRLEPEREAALFLRKWDENADGGVDLKELEPVYRLFGADPLSNRLNQLTPLQRQGLVEAYDTNRTARLEIPELGKLLTDDITEIRRQVVRLSLPANLRPFDLNGDGKLDATERAAFDRARDQAMKSRRLMIGQPYDHNGDGELDAAEQAEFKSKAPKLFEIWQKSQANTLPPPVIGK